ncbi:MAG: ATP-binding cassette domain-containing protein [Zetaproteobacteria bacterium]|nr:ATP-binding cassette domain-containing protein [Zetaproteobacteria bacterium]
MLNISNLSFGYPLKPILHNFSLQMQRGECLHIIGENGSGKSTLLKLISGFLLPTAGSIQWAIPHPRSETAHLDADSNGLYLQLSAFQNLQLGKNHTYTQQRQALTKWGIRTPYIQNSLAVKKFSTGMRRRLALCRLEQMQKMVWVLDEPLNGLDSNGVDLLSHSLNHKITQLQGCVVVTGHQKMMAEVLPPQTRAIYLHEKN